MAKMKILIVDDDELNTIIIDTYLAELNSVDKECIIYTNPVEALKYLETNQVDFVIVDYMMPHIDGMKFIKKFRQNEANKEVPVVMVTSAEEERLRDQAMQAGADDFLNKPVDAVELIARAKMLLALRAKTIELVDVNKKLAKLNSGASEALARVESRRTFLHHLDAAMSKATEDSKPLSVITLDINNFRKFNYTYGYTAGDMVVKSLAHKLSDTVAEKYMIGRIDGQEFAVCLPETSLAQAKKMADGLKKAILEMPLEIYGQKINISVSVGCAEMQANEHWSHSLIQRSELDRKAKSK